MDLSWNMVNFLVVKWGLIRWSRMHEQIIQAQQVLCGGELAEAQGVGRVVSRRGHLWGALGDTARAGLCQPSKSKGRRSPSLLIPPIPRAFKECEMSKGKWKVKRRRKFLSTGAQELDHRSFRRLWGLLKGPGVIQCTPL